MQKILILFWQFAISSLEELDIVSNQHLSIEMFLIRLMHLSSIKLKKKIEHNLDNEKLRKYCSPKRTRKLKAACKSC